MAAGSVRLVVTSPPYNIKNSTGNGLKDGRGGKWPRAALQGGYDGHDDQMPHEAYVAWQRECLTEMLRLTRPDGAVFYNHKWRVQGGLLQRLGDAITHGFPVRQVLIWQRAGGFNHNPGYFLPTYEVVYFIAVSRETRLTSAGRGLGDVGRPSSDHRRGPDRPPDNRVESRLQQQPGRTPSDDLPADLRTHLRHRGGKMETPTQVDR